MTPTRMTAADAFVSDSTHSYNGNCYFVHVDPNLAQLVRWKSSTPPCFSLALTDGRMCMPTRRSEMPRLS